MNHCQDHQDQHCQKWEEEAKQHVKDRPKKMNDSPSKLSRSTLSRTGTGGPATCQR